MRSRRIREGSVGLLLLLGVGVLGLIILWLTRFTAARSSYKAIVEFANAGGMQRGSVVRYRGVKVGRISDIQPGANAVEVIIEILDPDLIMPNDVKVEANQSGLISENIIDITPKTQLPPGAKIPGPLSANCNPQVIVCNGSRLKGQVGISIDELIRTTTELATVYTNPEFYRNVNKAVENTAVAAASVAELTRSLNVLSKGLQQQITSITATTNTIQQATTQLTASSTQALNQISATANQFGTTANQFGATAREVRLTTNQVSKLINNLDTLVTSNRSSLVTALDNLTATSKELRQNVSSLSPVVNRVTQGELLENLETLSENAARASTNLREVTNALSSPNNLLVLQQTLDSARVTFENTQKITSDLDELTGDPAFRENLRQLVNGLSTLVSSTQQIQQHVQVASTLDSVKSYVYNPNAIVNNPPTHQPQITFDVSRTTVKNGDKNHPPTSINFVTPSQKTISQQMTFDVSPTTVKSADKILPPTSVNLISPTIVKSARQKSQLTRSSSTPSSQEKLLQQLREHREQ
ncbi:MAG: MlaD family protein [Scytonema sp. PMC 1069.18]|nr:MlaD family protein [Scytonema sp. PMC 1069.18]MEC4880244.1 MlaD family protein [Scytonema sp. PMC 1070.18]